MWEKREVAGEGFGAAPVEPHMYAYTVPRVSSEPETYYYSVIIPYSETPSPWHPTDREGPFSVLSRGAFRSRTQAEAWADRELGGQPYSVKRYRDY